EDSAPPSCRATRKRRCQRCRGKVAANPSSVSSPGLAFERIQECRNARGTTKAKQHQTKVEGKNTGRSGQQDPGQGATAEIRQDGLTGFAEGECRIIQVEPLHEAAH